MKPSEFWAQIFALPEQARQAESEAAELRIRADALCGWARLAASVHRSAIDDADVGGIEEGKKHLDALPPYPDGARVGSLAEQPATLPERTRKQRSDAGKPRETVRERHRAMMAKRKEDGSGPHRTGSSTLAIYDSDPDPPEADESAPANPAVVKAEDAARVKLAGQVRGLMESERVERGSCEPFTIYAMQAVINASEADIRGALKLLSLVSWRMQREGDSQPVEVWGTLKQLGAYATTLAEDEGCDLPEALGVSDRLLASALKAAS